MTIIVVTNKIAKLVDVTPKIAKIVKVGVQGPAGPPGDADSIVSTPGSGEYKVVNIKINAAGKIVIVYEDTPEP